MTVGITGVLNLFPARPRLLALGEPTHGSDVLLELRNDLFRHLVEQEGYRTIAIESDCLMGRIVDDYVTSGAGVLDDVLARGFSHEWGAFPGNRSLVRWMRAHNDARPAEEQVRFAGFDGPLEIHAAASPRQSLMALHGYLADPPHTADALDDLLGADDRWTNPAAMMDPSQSVGRTAEANQLRLLADDLVTLLDAETPDSAGMAEARLHARTATGLLRYHRWMADPSPNRMARLLSVRDSMMAANLLALADRGPVLANGHNAHFQRNRSSMRMGDLRPRWWSAGAIVNAHLGDGYRFLATALGTFRDQGVDTPPPDTIEGRLYALPDDRFIVDAGGFDTLLPRVSPWFGYAPLDPAQVTNTDGIVFVKDA
ncbi:erythromycin esterase family protein [Asanoa ferruginea]|nr:erythromycin esterase family protein [Asanoa ferruginea]